ncbi:OmpA family protein [Mucilaginibacter lacusdianchii]|uniref:OmpA family protein n=1 Tax=Mucilaginibacter lacusdianchii TaxID=2684211 RepID=UPI00131B42BC|nr:OmpA family protein [Mucilaginibacter sp. JXJ CY 39]
MAELDVRPKKGTPWWLWLLLLLIVLALLFYFLKGRNGATRSETTTDSTTTVTTDSSTTTDVATTTPGFNNVDFENAPRATYDEITDTAITVRGGDKYAIYSLGENVLFATDQNTLQGSAANQLKQVAASLEKRFKNYYIGVYGHTDSKGDAGHNKDLGAKRAEAVRNWLVKNGNISESKVSLHSFGESEPLASNATAAGRQQNRSVEIVAIPDTAGTKQ